MVIPSFESLNLVSQVLRGLEKTDYPDLEVIIIDNASTDGTVDILEHFEDRCAVIYNSENVGFAAAQNQAIALSRGDWVLTLNPDVFLLPGFIEALLEGGRLDPGVGTVCGKLFSMSPGFEIPDQPIVDSTGIYFTPTLRHLDRGSQEVDRGHYVNFEYVFGATAAAALYSRQMIDDIAINGEFFDSDFFVYREDADVAWRAQLLGWRCLYTPLAVGYHVRRVFPGVRRNLPSEINQHSVKNRFLMRIKNITPGLYRRHWFSITVRDAVVVAACLLREHTSLKAFRFVFNNWTRTQAKRKEIMRRRRITDDDIARWFSFTPVSHPAPRPAGHTGTQTRANRGAG